MIPELLLTALRGEYGCGEQQYECESKDVHGPPYRKQDASNLGLFADIADGVFELRHVQYCPRRNGRELCGSDAQPHAALAVSDSRPCAERRRVCGDPDRAEVRSMTLPARSAIGPVGNAALFGASTPRNRPDSFTCTISCRGHDAARIRRGVTMSRHGGAPPPVRRTGAPFVGAPVQIIWRVPRRHDGGADSVTC